VTAELFFLLGIAGYSAAFVLFFIQMALVPTPPWTHRGPWALCTGAVGHAAYVVHASLVAQVCPVTSVPFALSVASLSASAVFLLARRRWQLDVLGAFVAPLGLTFLFINRFTELHRATPRFSPAFLTLHVAANLLGDALFLLSCVAALLYLFVEKRLKQKRPAVLFGRLPPLDALDRAEHRFLLSGFPLLTLGIVTGTLWARHLTSGQAVVVLRASLGYLTWLVFAGVLLLRAAAGWRGRRAAVGTIVGFVLAMLLLFVYLVRPAPTPLLC